MATAADKMTDNVQFLIESGPLRGSNGCVWGPDGKIYQGSVWSNAAFVVDPETGEIEEIEGSHGTDDMAFHPDGRLFFNWIARGEVGVRDTDGKVSLAATVKGGNDGIAISKEGRIFTSGLFMDVNLYEIYPDGDRKPRVVANQGQRMSNAMSFGPDGKLYGSSWVTGEAIQIDMETGATLMVGQMQGANLSAAHFNSKGELHVMDTTNGAIYKVNRENYSFELVAQTPAPATDNFFFSPDDRLFNSSSADGYIHEITGKDTYRVVVPGGLGLSGGATLIDDKGKSELVVVDIFAIRKFDPKTGKPISAVRDITMSTDVGWMLTVNPYGKQLVTSSWTANFVKIWDPATDSMVTNFGNFKQPTNATALGKDIVFTELGGAIKRFSPAAPDKVTTLADGLKQPFGLAYHDGALYVSEDQGGKVVQIMELGKVITPKVIKDGLSSPQGLAIANGRLYVVEGGKG
jgi:WD40 repeat protein